MRTTNRRDLLRQADAILKADNDNKPAGRQARFRGGRPALNWLSKHDAKGAACLWYIARQRLPQAANDNQPIEGMGIDRRPSGKPRGKDPARQSIEAYLALPGIQPRLGDAEPKAARLRGWDGESRGIAIKPQRTVFDFHPDCRFGYCAPGVAYGASFLGARGGLGKPRPNTRGDIRTVDAPAMPTPPAEVDSVIEAVISRATVAGVGEALGARGGYADRRGKKALRAAAEWAMNALAV